MMQFRDFIRKDVVVYEEEIPQEPQQQEPNKQRILTPDKRLILPAQPKREKPQGFTPSEPRGPRKVDAFPNKTILSGDYEDMDTPNLRKYAHNLHNKVRSYFVEMGGEKGDLYDKYLTDPEDEYSFDDEASLRDIQKETDGMSIGQILDHDNMAFKHYVMGSYDLGDYLRYGMPPMTSGWDPKSERFGIKDYDLEPDEFKYVMRLLHDILMNQMESNFHDDVFRGLNFDPFEDLKEGQIISDPAFMSTASEKMGTASDFAGDFGVLMHIHNAANRDSIDMDYWGDNDQDEIVYPPNTALQFTHRDEDNNPHFNMLMPSFEDIDKYGRVINRDYDEYNRSEMGFLESRKPLRLINKMKDKLREAFGKRMNDFQFQVLTPQKKEDKPEPKEFRDVLRQMVDIDD